MMAKAIVDCQKESIPTIGLWGIMQHSEAEEKYQKPGVHYFITMANKAGIRVVCPEESKLFEPQQVEF
jgi:hypothetical protein